MNRALDKTVLFESVLPPIGDKKMPGWKPGIIKRKKNEVFFIFYFLAPGPFTLSPLLIVSVKIFLHTVLGALQGLARTCLLQPP
jgi:hypothetical protein